MVDFLGKESQISSGSVILLWGGMSKIIIFERIKFFGGIGVHFPRTGGGGFFGRGVEMIFLEG